MSFDISKLTGAVNKYLNSISELSNLGQKIQQEIADKGRFSTELSSAIQKEIDSAFEKTAATKAIAGNKDAYSGILSTEALQELSKSQYFSGNLIQDSLFKEDNGTENSSTSTSSAFDGVSLSDLNNKSLLANDILKAYAKSATSISPTSIFGDFSL